MSVTVGWGGGRLLFLLNSEPRDEVRVRRIVVDYVISVLSDCSICVWPVLSMLKVFVCVSTLSVCPLTRPSGVWCVRLPRLVNGWLFCVVISMCTVLIFMPPSVFSVQMTCFRLMSNCGRF